MTKENTAHHEGGHATMCVLLNVVITTVKIEKGEGGWKGSTSHFQAASVKQDVMISLAGQVAQQRYHPDPASLGSWNDYYNAFVALDGDLDLLKQYEKETELMLNESWGDVEIVAAALLVAGSLSGEQVSKALRATESVVSDSC